jgi:hypothetical protein
MELGLGLRGQDDESDSALDAEHTEVIHRRVKESKACSYEHRAANEVRGRWVQWHCNTKKHNELNVRKMRR